MATLQSKNVNIVLDSNNDVDLYDEQIDNNKSLSEQNAKDIKTLRGLINNNGSEITLVKGQIQNIQNATPVLTKADANKLRQDIDKVTQVANSNKTNLTNLTNTVTNNTKVINNTQSNITNLTTIVKQIDNATTGGLYTGGGSGGSSSGYAKEINDLKNRLTTDEGNISTADAKVNANTTSINNLSSQFNNLNSTLSGQITTINNKNNAQDTRLNNLENKFNGLNTQINGSSGSGGTVSVQTQIINVKSDVDKLKNATIPSIQNLSSNAYNKVVNLQSYVTNTIERNLTDVTNRVTDTENDITTINNNVTTVQNQANTNKTNITNNANAIQRIQTKIRANVQDKTIASGGSATINYDSSMDLYSMQIKVLVLDNVSGSRTVNKYINSEGIATLAYNSKNSITIYNDADTQLSFKIIVSL